MKIFNAAIIAIGLTVGFAHTASAEYLPENTSKADQIDSLELMVTYLSEDGFVRSRLEFRQVSADPVEDLAEIAGGRYSDKLRNRAIQSLALYRSDARAEETISELIEQIRPGHKLFPAVLVSYGHIKGEEAVADIEAFASHDRPDVRMAAVVALGRFGGTAGYHLLQELADQEEHEVVRERIETYIR
ncbi:MAG: HEAT repeat domain-containing protein [Persicimonas sp.]